MRVCTTPSVFGITITFYTFLFCHLVHRCWHDYDADWNGKTRSKFSLPHILGWYELHTIILHTVISNCRTTVFFLSDRHAKRLTNEI